MSFAQQLDQNLRQANSSSSSSNSSSSSEQQVDKRVIVLNHPTDMSQNAPNAQKRGSNASLISFASDNEEEKRKHSTVNAPLEGNHSDNQSEEEDSESIDQETAPPEKKRRRRRKSHSKHDDIIASNPELDLHNDLTTVEGQLKRNPNMTQQEAETASKREYNRRNAARARLRNKHMVAELQEQCAVLTQRTEDLTRENEILRAQLELLQKQPAKQQPEPSPPAAPTPSLNDTSAILGQLSGIAPPQMGGFGNLHSSFLFGNSNPTDSIQQRNNILGLPTTLVAPELLRQLQQQQSQQQSQQQPPTTQPSVTSSLDLLTQFVQQREQTARNQALLALLNRNSRSNNNDNNNDPSSENN